MATPKENKQDTTVQPIESVDKAPENKQDTTGEICWNCKNHDSKTKNRLDENGVCEICGFEKDKLYNGNIEADKAAQRIEAARAAERI